MGTIFNPTQTAKFINADGTPTPQMILYLNEILERVGGSSGGIYKQLSSAGSAILWNLDSEPISVVRLQNGPNILIAIGQVAGFLYPYRLTLIQPAAGAAGTVTWPANFLFPGGIAPVLTAVNNAIDMLFFVADQTNIYLTVEALNYS